tara:strand:- start:97 stop:1299 length:1203 start_codon:yes stop_codon:yes gene_type:complete
MLDLKNNKSKCIFDIGTNKIVCLICDITKDSFNIQEWSHKQSLGLNRSKILNIDKVSKSILETTKEIKKKIDKINVNITDIDFLSKKNYSEINIGGIKISKKEIRKSFRKNLQNSNLSQKNLIHSIPLNFIIDGTKSSSDPFGIFCNNLGVNTFNIWINTVILRNLENCFRNANILIENSIDTSFASAEACLTEQEKIIGSTCIDLGAGSAKIATFFKGGLEYINYVPLGGNDVTNDIQRGLEIPKDLAEYIKIIYGSLEFTHEKNFKINLTHGKQKIITQNLLHGIIKPRYEEILEIIRDKLQDNLVTKIGVNNIVLTGGASQIPGLTNFASKIFNRKTRLSSPQTKFSFLNKPEFSTCVGLMKMKSDLDLKKIIKSVSNNKVFNLIESFDNWVKESFM